MKTNKKDISIIPLGDYCYNSNGLCPYWESRSDVQEQECGYCNYLEKGDYEMNDIKKWRRRGGDGTAESAHELGLPMSLLWDQVKECGVNVEGED